MKNIFKFLMMGLMVMTFAASASTTIFAQDPAATPRTLTPEQQTEKQAIYDKFLANRKGPEVAKFEIAVSAGEEFLQKYGDDAEIAAYINKQLPPIKKFLDANKSAGSFDSSLTSKNWDGAFAAGKSLLATNPDNIDVMLVLASVGFDNATATPPVDKYNTDTINYAKAAIQKINEGKPSLTKNYGAGAYVYTTTKYADGKNNALGWMNYTIGLIMANRMNQKKEALPYLYKATQTPGFVKDSPDVYALIGTYYRDEYNRIVTDRAAKIAANGNKETPETREALGMQQAYADRAINAYATALKVANANPDVKPDYKKGLTDNAKLFYKARFDKDEGADAYIAAELNKPFVDPTSAVVPVAVESLEPTPAPATTPTTTGTPAATTPATTTPTTTATPKPSTTTPTAPATKPATTPAKPTPSATPKPRK
jgi:hypothetical protein